MCIKNTLALTPAKTRSSSQVMKQSSPTKPRLVIYVTPAEMRATKHLARRDGLRTPHQFAAAAYRKALIAQSAPALQATNAAE